MIGSPRVAPTHPDMRVLDFASASAVPAGSGDPSAFTGAPATALPEDTAAVLGAFDGMHRGHQALIARARSLASRVAVVTFEPRPADVLAPDKAPPRLQSARQRERVCRDLGVDLLVVLRFDRSVSQLSPESFVRRFLIDGLAPAHVVVGYDFHFGAGRAGGPADLAALLAPASIGVSVVERVASSPVVHEKLGSTAIRELVAAGRVEEAAALLGRWYALEGEVRHGAARGRTLGFPTANVASPGLHPASGVYACFLTLLERSSGRELETWPAVANLGSNPTFADGPATTTGLEVHALDVQLGDRLYGHEVEVAFVARLRDEQKFPGPDALREAIIHDIERARPLLDEGAAAFRRARPVTALASEGRPMR